MKITTQIGSGRPQFELPNDKFFDAAGKPFVNGIHIKGLMFPRCDPVHPSENRAPPIDPTDPNLEGRN